MVDLHVDFMKISSKIKNKALRFLLLDKLLNQMIPFKQGLGLKILEITDENVIVESPDKRHRKNHMGGAHSCAIALLSEYTAGLFVAQKYPINKYCISLSSLNVEYYKQGRGVLKAACCLPKAFPIINDGEGWLHLETIVSNATNETIAKCNTRWQIKEWELVP